MKWISRLHGEIYSLLNISYVSILSKLLKCLKEENVSIYWFRINQPGDTKQDFIRRWCCISSQKNGESSSSKTEAWIFWGDFIFLTRHQLTTGWEGLLLQNLFSKHISISPFSKRPKLTQVRVKIWLKDFGDLFGVFPFSLTISNAVLQNLH